MTEFDPVSRPSHYAAGRKYEPIDVIEDWVLGFHEANALKYISRSGRKDNQIQDLEKAVWYLERRIEHLKDIESEEFVKAVNPGQHIDHNKLVKNALKHEVISSDEAAPVPRVEVRDDATELVTVEDARGIASDGLDLDEAASEVGNADTGTRKPYEFLTGGSGERETTD